jgi:hypothetical protein
MGGLVLKDEQMNPRPWPRISGKHAYWLYVPGLLFTVCVATTLGIRWHKIRVFLTENNTVGYVDRVLHPIQRVLFPVVLTGIVIYGLFPELTHSRLVEWNVVCDPKIEMWSAGGKMHCNKPKMWSACRLQEGVLGDVLPIPPSASASLSSSAKKSRIGVSINRIGVVIRTYSGQFDFLC